MKIWRIFENTDQVRFWYFPTKAEAVAFRRKRVADFSDDDYGSDSWQVEPIEVRPTREGIAQAMQDVIDSACFNE